jgi:type VI secretion system secreted protein Hcp
MKRPIHLIASLIALTGLGLATPAVAQITAYLEIPDIPGESAHQGHESWIDLASFYYPVVRQSSAPSGSARSRSVPVVGPVELGKWADAASVYLNLATLQGRTFSRIVVEIFKDGELQLRYRFENVKFVSYTQQAQHGDERVTESLALTFERIHVLYVEPANDQSAGDEHELEYDVTAQA